MSTEPDLEVTVRGASVDDQAEVIRLDADATGLAKPAYWQDVFARYVVERRQNRFFLIAETGERIAGFIVGETRVWEFGSPPCGWVFAVNVVADLREHGIGSRLLNEIADRFRAAGVDTVRTMVSRNDTLNLSFFRAHGMTAGPYIELEKRLD